MWREILPKKNIRNIEENDNKNDNKVDIRRKKQLEENPEKKWREIIQKCCKYIFKKSKKSQGGNNG